MSVATKSTVLWTEKSFNCVFRDTLCGMLLEYGIGAYPFGLNCRRRSDPFRAVLGFCQGCLLSLILFTTFTDRIPWCSQYRSVIIHQSYTCIFIEERINDKTLIHFLIICSNRIDIILSPSDWAYIESYQLQTCEVNRIENES